MKNMMTILESTEKVGMELFNRINPDLLFNNAIENNWKVLVVYHKRDIDGHGIKIMAECLNCEYNLNNPIEIFGCEIRADEAYEHIQNNNYDLIIVADLSFTKEFMITKYSDIADKTIVLDHHVSSLYMNDYDNCIVIPHDEETLTISSGSLLFAKYLLFSFDKQTKLIEKMNYFAIVTALYDTWFWNSEDESIRAEIKISFDNNPENLALYFKSLTDKEDYDRAIIANIFSNDYLSDDLLLNSEQRLVSDIMRNMNKQMCYKYYHNLKILKLENGQTIGIVFGMDDVSTIGNFILRANKELDYFMMIDLNSSKVSLRSRKNFDLIENVIKFTNGGGHPQAAGFDSSSLSGSVDSILKVYLSSINYKGFYTLDSIKNIGVFNEETQLYELR